MVNKGQNILNMQKIWYWA